MGSTFRWRKAQKAELVSKGVDRERVGRQEIPSARFSCFQGRGFRLDSDGMEFEIDENCPSSVQPSVSFRTSPHQLQHSSLSHIRKHSSIPPNEHFTELSCFILWTGASSVGKSSLLLRFTDETFLSPEETSGEFDQAELVSPISVLIRSMNGISQLRSELISRSKW